MTPERQAMMAGLPLAVAAAAAYLAVTALHLFTPGPLAHALLLAVLMTAGIWVIALMFPIDRADTTRVYGGLSVKTGEDALVKVPAPLNSVDEEERLISQLEAELEMLEERYRSELTAMQDAASKNGGPSGERGRSQWGHE